MERMVTFNVGSKKAARMIMDMRFNGLVDVMYIYDWQVKVVFPESFKKFVVKKYDLD